MSVLFASALYLTNIRSQILRFSKILFLFYLSGTLQTSSQPPFWTIQPKACLNVCESTVLAGCAELSNAPKCPHWPFEQRKTCKKTIFYFLKADASRSKCSFKVKRQAVNLDDGDVMKVLCQLKNRHEFRTTSKLLKVVRF